MTRLRQQMLEELQRRNYSQGTIATYLRTIEDFAHAQREIYPRICG